MQRLASYTNHPVYTDGTSWFKHACGPDDTPLHAADSRRRFTIESAALTLLGREHEIIDGEVPVMVLPHLGSPLVFAEVDEAQIRRMCDTLLDTPLRPEGTRHPQADGLPEGLAPEGGLAPEEGLARIRRATGH